jgi:hypothetical protein
MRDHVPTRKPQFSRSEEVITDLAVGVAAGLLASGL